MNYSKAILNIQSRINTLKKEWHPELGEHPHIIGLREAIRILESIKLTNSIDPYLQTK